MLQSLYSFESNAGIEDEGSSVKPETWETVESTILESGTDPKGFTGLIHIKYVVTEPLAFV
jgi:hypothetical protein